MEDYVGKRIDDRYEIHEIIGVGGMAYVYKAYDCIDDRIVAVKILREEYLANEAFRRRFKNESKYIAVLSHPNIVKVYDVSFGDRLQYIVMEYIEGITLKEYIERQNVISPKEAVHFLTQILRALQHAHDKGIVHRDIKPQNIMLLQNGTIKVTDFGIASFSRSESRTISDGAIGSVHYISPEQAKGEFTDAKADIYSVGVMMYEMLTGQLPFQADTAVSVALMQVNDEAVAPRNVNGNIPIGLEQITMRAMQKDPKLRYQSAAEMLLDLDEFKRNPSIKFDYSYFVDNEPTKYIDRTMTSNTPFVREDSPSESEEDGDSVIDDEEAARNKKLIPILTGVVAGLAAVSVLIAAYLFLFTDVMKSNKLEVPNFINKNYETEIVGNDAYKAFKIEPVYEYDSDAPYGVVVKQDPEKGKRVKVGQTITVTVNQNQKKIPVPDVYGQKYVDANETLKAAGFSTKYEMKYDATAEEGTVVSTSPEREQEALLGSEIIIYVATLTDKEAVLAPNVVGYSENDARDMLKSVDLSVGTITQRDDSAAAGTVLEQIPAEGEQVHPGESVDLIVSTGKAPSVATSISVKLPYVTGSDTGTLKAYLNSVAFATEEVLLNGGTYNIAVGGSGKSDKLIVKVDNKDIYSCTINFTTDPVALSDVSTIEDDYKNSFYYGASASIPSVEGMTLEKAKATLKASGFVNITVNYDNTLDSKKIGKVLSQNPDVTGLDRFKRYTTDTEIVLTVGKGVLS
ncbi:MAG TPA: Stk1 family PASTA domain-containing Ser/Thr kinase [Ruminococcaceae bacterium]|nr:Stk1 family PASTA domain-containing Ser/Thr kinase [Oscillospiraceae bacterium]